jgi:hypothetical protein
MEENFWIYDPKILFIKFSDIYPRDTNNNFNAICRYFLVAFIIFLLFSKYQWVYISFIGFIITTIIGIFYTQNENKENKIEKIKKHLKCRRTTINNPMGNVLFLDENPELEACSDDEHTKIKNNIHWEYYEDEIDLNTKTKLRNFIKMPVTSLLNKRENFTNFLYDQSILTCKYDGIRCEKYRDIRYNK